MNMKWNELKDRVYKCACNHGFHNHELSDEHHVGMIITEVAEAIEADRKGAQSNVEDFKKHLTDPWQGEDANQDMVFYEKFKFFIKNGVADELADVVIRILDMAGDKGVEFDEEKLNKAIASIMSEDLPQEMRGKTMPEFGARLCAVLNEMNKDNMATYMSVIITSVVLYFRYIGADFEWHIMNKIRFNELRPYLNGKKY